jgi:rhodanese-related sulfurtransferase
MKEITPTELKEKLSRHEPLQLIDVREEMEWEFCNLGGTHIPLGDLPRHVQEISAELPVVLVCHHGVRSAQALRYLEHTTGRNNFLNLKGGIHAWALQVDPEMPVY